MSTIGPITVFDATIASAGTISGEVDLGGAYGKVSLMVPSMISKTTASIQIASESGGTYYDAYYAPTSATAPVPVQVHANVANGAVVELPIHARYIKVKIPSAPVVAAGYKIICSSN